MACQLFLNICKQQGIIPFSFHHIYVYDIQSCSSKLKLQNGSMIDDQGQFQGKISGFVWNESGKSQEILN